MLQTKCATCGELHEFDMSYLCLECKAAIVRAKHRGREAIRATVLFNKKRIGFAELKKIYAEAGFEIKGEGMEEVIAAVKSIPSQ
jgi:DNA-directed RNA polymerase subunit RPC12/RpoP